MNNIMLDKDLYIKKLDPNNQKDIYLVNELESDSLVCGRDGYLWPISNEFRNVNYLQNEKIYASPFAIYDGYDPVGYITLSDIIFEQNIYLVDVAYAILESKRKKGYASKTLLEVSKKILLDQKANVEKVSLLIEDRNIASKMTALKAGFVYDDEYSFKGLGYYQKTKSMIRG